MQRLLVIFALGLGLLLPACAVQDLPFSGGAVEQDSAAPTPYRPQQGAVHDGSTDGGDVSVPQPIPAYAVPMPASVAPVSSHAGANMPPAQGAGGTGGMQNTPPAQSLPAGQSAPSGAPKPVTKTASGLQEREL